jgi:hypothetical protein
MYFSYLAISCKVVLVHIDDLFICSSLVHHIDALVLDDQGLSIQLASDLYMFSVVVHNLESRVRHKHDPLILLNRHRKAQIRLCA